MYKLMIGNRTILDNTRTGYVAFFPEEQATSYKRFMWRFDGSKRQAQFQGSGIKINGISLPYTFVDYYMSGSVWGDGAATNLIDSDETNKWGGSIGNQTTGYGWIIFDLPSAVIPEYYELKTANDTANEDRRPARSRLYASEETPTTFDDASWVLLDDRDPEWPLSNLTWVGPYTLNQV